MGVEGAGQAGVEVVASVSGGGVGAGHTADIGYGFGDLAVGGRQGVGRGGQARRRGVHISRVDMDIVGGAHSRHIPTFTSMVPE